MRRRSEYSTLSKLVDMTSRNFFVTGKDSDNEASAAVHYSYNLTKQTAKVAESNESVSPNRNEQMKNNEIIASGHSRYSKGECGGEKQDKTPSKRSYLPSGQGRGTRLVQRHDTNVSGSSVGDSEDGGNVLGSSVVPLPSSNDSKVWRSAYTRDSTFYARQQSTPESADYRVTRFAKQMRHNSLPADEFLSCYGRKPAGHSAYDPSIASKRRKKGVCDESDGSHYQRQFLRVLKKRFWVTVAPSVWWELLRFELTPKSKKKKNASKDVHDRNK